MIATLKGESLDPPRHLPIPAQPDSLWTRLEIASEGRELAHHMAKQHPELAKRLIHRLSSAALVEAGAFAEARDHLRDVRLALRIEEPTFRIWTVMEEIVAGRFASADTAIEELAFAPMDIRQNPLVNVAMGLQRVWMRLYQRRSGELLPIIEAGLIAFPRRLMARLLRIASYEQLGRTEEAREELERVLDNELANLRFDREWLPTLSFASMLVSTLGSEQHASLLYGLLRLYEDRIAMVCWTIVCLGSVSAAHQVIGPAPIGCLLKLTRPPEDGTSKLAFRSRGVRLSEAGLVSNADGRR